MSDKKIKDQTVTIPAGNTEAAMIEAQDELNAAVEKEMKNNTEDTKTAAKEEAIAKVYVEQSGYSLGTMGTGTYYSTNVVLPANPNDVKFEVTHPKDTGMPKGVVVVSKESAEHFKSLGLGKIVD